MTKKSSRKSGVSLLRSNMKEKVKSPEKVAKETAKALALYKVKPQQKIKVTDPITKKTSIVNLDRTGFSEAKLITALADPKLKRDRKDHELSMYLFSRGAEGASMMLDLMRYKGEHSKETRVFKSQMRFDFEAFVDSMVMYLQGQADRTAKILGVDLQMEISQYRSWLLLPNNKGREYTYADFRGALNDIAHMKCLMISEAMFALDEAERLEASRANITKAREREKGGGVYVDVSGKVYSIDDPEIDEIIKSDREATSKIETD